MAVSEAPAANDPRKGIAFILFGMLCISVNDVLIKWLSGDYPLHEMIFARSTIGLAVSLAILQFEGGFRELRTARPFMHLLRGLLVVMANMTYFTALAVLPLAEATALFFVAPLFITVLSVPLLGERVGPFRMAAVVIGFGGVLLMLRPAGGAGDAEVDRLTLLLPMVSAFFYACFQILTRRLGATSKASAMAVYIQSAFIGVSFVFLVVAGDGRFAEGVENESLRFLLRSWRWPPAEDLSLFLALGTVSGFVGYCMSQAYRSADVAVVAPFEYVALPLAILWGWSIFGHLPGPWVMAGIALIVGAGLAVFLRERRRSRPVDRRPLRRW
jgi:S-adenosylmethionine uptake transporter